MSLRLKIYDMSTNPRKSSRVFAVLVMIIGLLVVMFGRWLIIKTSVPDDIYISHNNDTVKYLGLHNAHVWIEKKSGERGVCDYGIDDVSFVSKHKKKDLVDYTIPDTYGLYCTTDKKIEEWAIGKSFEEIENNWRKATTVLYIPSGQRFVAIFNMIGALGYDGKFYSVEMSFDGNRICNEVLLHENVRDTNDWLLKNLPFVNNIVSQKWIMMNVQDSVYDRFYNTKWIWKILMFIPVVFLLLVWTCLPIYLPPLVAYLGLLKIKALEHVPDLVLVGIIDLCSIVIAYVWTIALLCWGYYWFILIPLMLFALFHLIKEMPSLFKGSCSTVPVRCPHCKAAAGLEQVSRTLQKKTLLHEPHRDHSSEEISHYDRNVKTIVCVSMFDGYRTTSDNEIMNLPVYKYTEVHKYHSYIIDYKVEDYDILYKCSECGYTVHKYEQVKNKAGVTDNGIETKEVELPEKVVLPDARDDEGIKTTYSLVSVLE